VERLRRKMPVATGVNSAPVSQEQASAPAATNQNAPPPVLTVQTNPATATAGGVPVRPHLPTGLATRPADR